MQFIRLDRRRGLIASMFLLLMIALIIPLLLMQPSPPTPRKKGEELPPKLPLFYQRMRGDVLISGAAVKSRNLYMKISTGNFPATFGNITGAEAVIVSSTLNAIRVLKGYVEIVAQVQKEVSIERISGTITVAGNVYMFINSTAAVLDANLLALLVPMRIIARVDLLGGSENGWNYSGVFNITAISRNNDWEVLELTMFLQPISKEDAEETLDDMYDVPENTTVLYMVIGPNSTVEIWTEYMEIEGSTSAVMNITDGVIEYESVSEKRVDVIATGPRANITVASLDPGGWMEVRVYPYSRVVIDCDPIVFSINKTVPLEMWAGSESWIRRGHFCINGTVDGVFLNVSGRMEVDPPTDGKILVGLQGIRVRFLNMSVSTFLRRLDEVRLHGTLDIRDAADRVVMEIPVINRFLNMSDIVNARLYGLAAKNIEVLDEGGGFSVYSNLTITENVTAVTIKFNGDMVSASHLYMRMIAYEPRDLGASFDLLFKMSDGTEVHIINASVASKGLEVVCLTLNVYNAGVCVDDTNLTMSAAPDSILNISSVGRSFSLTAEKIVVRGRMRTEGRNFEIGSAVMDVWNGRVKGQNIAMRLVDGIMEIDGCALMIDISANGSGYSLALGRGGLEICGRDGLDNRMSVSCIKVNGTISSDGEFAMSGSFLLRDMTFVTDGAVLISGSFVYPGNLEVHGEFWVGGRSCMRGDLMLDGTTVVRGSNIINSSTYYVRGFVEMRNAHMEFHGTLDIGMGTVISTKGDVRMRTLAGDVELFLGRGITVVLDISVLIVGICLVWAIIRLTHMYLRGQLGLPEHARESRVKSSRALDKVMLYTKLIYHLIRERPAMAAAPFMLAPPIVLVVMCTGLVIPVYEQYDLYLLVTRVLASVSLTGLLIDLFADIKVHRKFIDWLTVK
ncbi:MAG: hypothetical protein ACTSXJ_09625 [Candidatus Baldrarchaeia archaeon]